jgi:hypothetical protein
MQPPSSCYQSSGGSSPSWGRHSAGIESGIRQLGSTGGAISGGGGSPASSAARRRRRSGRGTRRTSPAGRRHTKPSPGRDGRGRADRPRRPHSHANRAPAAATGEAGIDGRVLAQDEAHPVAAGLELAALAGAALRLRDRLLEPLRARGAELDRQYTLHLDHPTQALSSIARPPHEHLQIAAPWYPAEPIAPAARAGARAGPAAPGSRSSSVTFMPPPARRRGPSASVRHEHQRRARPRPSPPRGATVRRAGRSTPPWSPRRLVLRA